MNYVIRTESGLVGGNGSFSRCVSAPTDTFTDISLQISSRCARLSPTRFTSGAPPPLGRGPASGIRSSALLWRLDSGEPLLYL